MTAVARAGALARACHPAPTAAVTVFATVLGAAAGNGAGACALLALAVLAGQLSIGWSNDRLDAARDSAVGRDDKPLATGELPLRHADVAVGSALVVTVAASFGLGWQPGLVHLGAVGCGWAYNARLKATAWSWLPYAAAFAALPVIATLMLPGRPWPAGWVVAAGALLGLAGHLTNALPDLDGDRRTGVRGLPHRIGAPWSLLAAAALLVGATVLVSFGPPGGIGPLAGVALAASGCAAAGAVTLARTRPASRLSFYGLVVVVALDLAVIVVSGHRLR